MARVTRFGIAAPVVLVGASVLLIGPLGTLPLASVSCNVPGRAGSLDGRRAFSLENQPACGAMNRSPRGDPGPGCTRHGDIYRKGKMGPLIEEFGLTATEVAARGNSRKFFGVIAEGEAAA